MEFTVVLYNLNCVKNEETLCADCAALWWMEESGFELWRSPAKPMHNAEFQTPFHRNHG